MLGIQIQMSQFHTEARLTLPLHTGCKQISALIKTFKVNILLILTSQEELKNKWNSNSTNHFTVFNS